MKGLETERKPIRGKDLVLTIDTRFAENYYEGDGPTQIGGSRGGGRMDRGDWQDQSRRPTFNPNSWSGRLSRKRKEKGIDENERKPMIDKTIKAYFPGSVYKIVTAFAALLEGEIEASTLVKPGVMNLAVVAFSLPQTFGPWPN